MALILRYTVLRSLLARSESEPAEFSYEQVMDGDETMMSLIMRLPDEYKNESKVNTGDLKFIIMRELSRRRSVLQVSI
jgi:phage protein D